MLDSTLSELQSRAVSLLDTAADAEALETARVEFLGRKGSLASIGKDMGKLAPEERARIGKLLNAVKQDLESRYEARKAAFERRALDSRLASEWFDLTLPAPGPRPGSLHPLTQIQRELEQLFTSLGFAVVDGPEVETEFHNFDALNIPPTHPARDAQDTFWLADGHLLRTPHLSGPGARHGEVRRPRCASSPPAASSAMKRSTPATSTPSTSLKA